MSFTGCDFPTLEDPASSLRFHCHPTPPIGGGGDADHGFDVDTSPPFPTPRCKVWCVRAAVAVEQAIQHPISSKRWPLQAIQPPSSSKRWPLQVPYRPRCTGVRWLCRPSTRGAATGRDRAQSSVGFSEAGAVPLAWEKVPADYTGEGQRDPSSFRSASRLPAVAMIPINRSGSGR